MTILWCAFWMGLVSYGSYQLAGIEVALILTGLMGCAYQISGFLGEKLMMAGLLTRQGKIKKRTIMGQLKGS
jgi:hypothetical protein